MESQYFSSLNTEFDNKEILFKGFKEPMFKKYWVRSGIGQFII